MSGKKSTKIWYKHQHLAGIVPFIPRKMDLKTPFHPAFIPIADRFTVAERAILECSRIGCDSIWVIVPPEFPGNLQKNVGDWILDPVSLIAGNIEICKKFSDVRLRYIPIFYITQQHPDLSRKNNILFNILYAAKKIHDINTSIAWSIAPTRYYVSMPWTINSSWSLIRARKAMNVQETRHIFETPEGKSILTGHKVPFTFLPTDQSLMLKKYRECYVKGEDEQWKEIVGCLEGFEKLPLYWSHDLTSWEGYRGFFADKRTAALKRPKNYFYRQFFQDPLHDIPMHAFGADIRLKDWTCWQTTNYDDVRYNVDAVDYAVSIPEINEELKTVQKTRKRRTRMYANYEFGEEIKEILNKTDWDFDSLASELDLDEESEK